MGLPVGCLLCRIARGEVTVERIVETDHVIGFMNQGEALSRGHCVFFPRRHAPSLHEADDAALAEILVLVKTVARALGVETYNVLQNNGAIAGQTVFHAHVHLIPKWSESEGLVYERGRGRRIDQKEMAQRIRAGLARRG
jgi:diadenosine tetraphosphate (Ap4A) HIT family hydrolase